MLVLCFIFTMGLLNQAIAQQQFIPEFFTNRPLILLNDATSVGWNPAVLGIDTKADLAFLASYDRSVRSNQLFGAFYSQNGLGFGITNQRKEQLPLYTFVPFSFYAGGGVNILNERAWAGASFRYSEFGTSSIRFNGSLIYQPMEKMYVSAGITNFNSINSDNLQYQFSSSYALLDWLNLFGRIQFTSDSLLFAGEKRSIDIGLNASIQKNVINASFFVNPVLREARFGLECAIGAFTLGSLNEASTINDPNGRFRGGNLLLRIDPEYFGEHDVEESCTMIQCKHSGCKGRACTRALYGAYRCIREHCPGTPCRDHCFGPECHPKEECTRKCPICQHPIINNWSVNIYQKQHCTLCSCTHNIHNYYINNYWNYHFPTKYITRVDTVIKWKTRYITDTVYKYKTDTIVKVIIDCSKCDHDCSKCKHECPKCPNCPPDVGPKDKKDTTGRKGTEINIEFPFDSCTPYDENDPDIIKLIDSLKNYYPDTCIIIEGHTDSLGSDIYNLELSQCRADSVKKILERNGIDGMRITAIGRGECCPRDTNSTPEGRRRNRRIVYFLYPCPIEYNEIGKEEDDSVWEEDAWD